MAEGIEIIGLDAVAQGLLGAAQKMQEGQRVAMAIAMREVKAEAVMNHGFRTRTGALERSVTSEAGIVGGEVVGRVFLNSKVAPYARYVHFPWTRDKPIIPKEPRRALHWVVGGANIFRARVDKVAHYDGDPFLYDAFEAKLDETTAALAAASVKAIVEKLGGE
jgi:hypothetical protein